MGDKMYNEKEEVLLLFLDDIIPNRFQPREVFDEKALKELAVSIKEHGVIQPIIVRNINGKYEIIAGERRYKASALAGMTKIPAIIRNIDDKETSKVALLENLQRKNLNPIEEARTYQKILELDEMTQEELAKTMGKSQSSVANKLRLLGLPIDVQTALLKEQISERHARTLLMLSDDSSKKNLLSKIIDNKLTVKQTEEEIKMITNTNNNVESVDVSNSYINNKPLNPTINLQEEEQSQIKIAPPIEEGTHHENKFINYGELENSDDNENQIESSSSLFDTNINIEAVKEQSQDITNINQNTSEMELENTSALDDLLNFPAPSETNNSEGSNFLTPAEAIVKTDGETENTKQDYFKTPEFMPSDIPNINQPLVSETTSIINQTFNEGGKVTTEEIITKIKELIKDLEKNNVKVDLKEMNFPKSTQLIIKIEKE